MDSEIDTSSSVEGLSAIPAWQTTLSDDQVRRLAATIDVDGFARLPGFLSPAELAHIRAVAERAVATRGGEYAHFNGTDGLDGTVLADLPHSAAFQGLCRRLYEAGTGRAGPPPSFYQVFRCLKGGSGQRQSAYFHYDSYMVTALLPVAMPRRGAPGDLVIFPNMRRVRSSYLLNVLDKLVFENKPAQALLRRLARGRRLGATAIRLTPGDAYFFWGYRSLHANEVCDPGELRATALLHYGNPHARSLFEQARRNNGAVPADLPALSPVG